MDSTAVISTIENTVTVSISDNGRQTSSTAPDTVQSVLETFHRDGVVIIRNAVPHTSLDHLRTKMTADCLHLLTKRENPHFNHGKAAQNLSQNLPVSPEYLHDGIWANEYAIVVIENILGPHPQLAFVGANTALPHGVGRQAVHSDAYFPHLDFAFGVEVNIFLDDASADNGVTELWLGSHVGTNFKDQVPNTRGRIKKPLLDARAAVSPPIQPTVPKGSIVLRDLRTWHAGMPNRSSTLRIMLGFIFFPAWYRTSMRVTFPLSAKGVVESWKGADFVATAQFVDGKVDYQTCRSK
ncbi:hypothetical protein BU26DRAFT_21386 [Trematosphaeria pertusa]|uniref:Phytanoyl-CoA dioxygenase family protein n=1 Tax=Trematosphaeria pertusa TaxID=390896 RepID=A0A6A6J1I8_9PLEO|nr:uncharacterized protein BU26DRAFT_21386 [Trematosphaeria pertusa]KAF2256418.1 hypothetical protein BU26DRAFT_21386 [Trematosphaeria pertusa]